MTMVSITDSQTALSQTHKFNSTNDMITTDINSIRGLCYDGISAQPQAAQLSIQGNEAVLKVNTTTHSEPLSGVDFGHHTQHGVRMVTFQSGAQFHASDSAALSAYLATHRAGQSWVDLATANWRWVAASAAGVVAVITALYLWGIPALASVAAPYVPQVIKNNLGDSALKGLDQYVFTPSTTDAATQTQLQGRWKTALNLAYPANNYPQHQILFRNMSDVPNAMALPNGTIVLTDGLVKLLADKPDAIVGVLAHELGHLEHHHSMRSLIEVSSLGLISSFVLGDHTVWVNQLPLLVGQLSYSRGHEGEADDAAIRIMQAAGIDPAELALFFERVELAERVEREQKTKSQQKESPAQAEKSTAWNVPDLLRSHPSSDARMKKLRQAGLPTQGK
jgi:Zn-dependent protease with chaperone function